MQKSERFLKEYIELENSDQRDQFIDSHLDNGSLSAIYKMDREIQTLSPSEEVIPDEQGVIMLFDDGSSLLTFHSESQEVSHYVPIDMQEDEDSKNALLDAFCKVSSYFEKDVKEYESAQENETYSVNYSVNFSTLAIGFISMFALAIMLVQTNLSWVLLYMAVPFTFAFPVFRTLSNEDLE